MSSITFYLLRFGDTIIYIQNFWHFLTSFFIFFYLHIYFNDQANIIFFGALLSDFVLFYCVILVLVLYCTNHDHIRIWFISLFLFVSVCACVRV